MMRKFLSALLCACYCAAALAQANQVETDQAAPAPQNRHQADERERQGSFPRLPPPERAETGAINPANGQYYPPAGNGDVINPATGERYLGIPGGYVNPNTGELMPRIR